MDKHTTSPATSIPQRPSSASSSRSRGSASSGDHGYASSHGDHPEPFILSGANTPAHETRPEAASSPLLHADDPRGKTTIPRSAGTNPIAIELPILPRKPHTAAAMTPPAPLSARGDVLGGYFPLHEDPTKRVRRTHPFDESESHPKAASPKGKAKAPKPALSPNAESGRVSSSKPSDTLLTSYVPSGVHGGSLPMGKYYPSNYEKRSHQQKAPPNPPKAAKPASHVPTYAAPGASQKPRLEGDARQKLQQYQRDMVAQATLAARKVMGGSHESNPTIPGFPPQGVSLSAPPTANPCSPRLRPLGSPGPVTPMELEASEGSYLDKGGRVSAADRSVRDRERRQPMSPGNRMRAETRSPAATPAF